MRAIGYYRLTHKDHNDLSQELQERFEDYCERYLHQPVAIFGDDPGAGMPGNSGQRAARNGNGMRHGNGNRAKPRVPRIRSPNTAACWSISSTHGATSW